MRRGISWLVGLAIVGSAMALLAPSPPADAGLISPDEEIEIGRNAAQQLEARYHPSADKRLDRIGHRIAQASDQPKIPYTFKVIESEEVNALSLPGGHVYIYRGLLRLLDDDDDALAGVLAHEISHISERHAAKQVEMQMGANKVLEFLSQGKLGQIAAQLPSLIFSRSDEDQADEMAVGTMKQAGYDPHGLAHFFKRLEEAKGHGRTISWLRNHPGLADRARRVEELTDTLRLHRSLR